MEGAAGETGALVTLERWERGVQLFFILKQFIAAGSFSRKSRETTLNGGGLVGAHSTHYLY